MVDLMALGGWKSEKTILECYQRTRSGDHAECLEEPNKGQNEVIPPGRTPQKFKVWKRGLRGFRDPTISQEFLEVQNLVPKTLLPFQGQP